MNERHLKKQAPSPFTLTIFEGGGSRAEVSFRPPQSGCLAKLKVQSLASVLLPCNSWRSEGSSCGILFLGSIIVRRSLLHPLGKRRLAFVFLTFVKEVIFIQLQESRQAWGKVVANCFHVNVFIPSFLVSGVSIHQSFDCPVNSGVYSLFSGRRSSCLQLDNRLPHFPKLLLEDTQKFEDVWMDLEIEMYY